MPYRAWGKTGLLYLFLCGLLLLWTNRPSIAQECCSQLHLTSEFSISSGAESTFERELLLLTNQYRIQRGLPELAPDNALIQIARQHSLEMARQGFISHSLPSGNLRVRMVRAGYLHEVARENVATAPSILGAQHALVESPGHEDNILAGDVTRVGIGIVRCPEPSSRQLYITEIFAAPRTEYQPETVRQMLVNRIDALRQSGAGSMTPDPALEDMASRSLHSISLPYRREDLEGLLLASSKELAGEDSTGLSKLQANVQLLHNPKNLSIPYSAQEGLARSYGAAVRRVTDSDNQAAFLVLTLIGVSR